MGARMNSPYCHDLLTKKRLFIEPVDLTIPLEVIGAARKYNVDGIVHLAAPPVTGWSPAEDYRTFSLPYYQAGYMFQHGIDGVCVGNTTLSREGVQGLPRGDEQGGLSGAPLKPIANQALATMSETLKGRIPIIGVGGINSAADALEKQRLGADLVQIYSGLIYQGPKLVREAAAVRL